MQKAVAFWGGALALGLSLSAWAGPTPQGAAVKISSCTTCIQQVPAVAGSSSGGFLTVWKGASAADPNGVSGRFFTSTGNPRGSDFLANKDLVGDQYDPAVAADAQGNFIVVWAEVVNGNSEIKGRRYQANGTPLGASFKVNQDQAGTPTLPADFNPTVAALKDGFIVAWMSLLPAGNGFPGTTPQVLGRKLSTTGAPLGNQVKISTGLVNGDRPDVCVDSSGKPVVVWTSVDGFPLFEANHQGVSLRRLTPAGAPVDPAETVVALPKANSVHPAVSCGSGSTFVVVWHSDQPPATERTDILAQRFTRLGRPAGPPFRVNTTVTKEDRNPSVAYDPKGSFVVVWQAYLDGVKVSILGRRFAASGAALSPEFEVFAGADNALVPSNPDIAPIGTAGNFVIVWQNGSQSISGRRFTP
ncbi:MAG: hypothetical protein ACJ76N_29845 [Thermoanaerobaculia bacterium]